MLLADSTQRTVGLVMLAIVALLLLAYLFFNIRSSKDELGSEIELAPNRKPGMPDEDLEGRRLDRSLGAGLIMLTVIGVALPLYWLGEPGRQEGRVEDTARIFTNRGEEIYVNGAQCAACHGAEGVGGAAPWTITSEDGGFIASVTWTAPALDNVMSRFSEDEILHTLNYGRNGVMPAWGAPGGGPLTSQQLEEVIFYLRSIQIDEDTIRSQVDQGVRDGVLEKLESESDEPWAVEVRDLRDQIDVAEGEVDDLMADQRELGDLLGESDEYLALEELIAEAEAEVASLESEVLAVETEQADAIAAAVDAWLADVQAVQERARAQAAEDDPSIAEDPEAVRLAALELLSNGEVDGSELYWEWGEVLFTNRAAAQSYNCARCHTYGYSFDGEDVVGIDGEPLVEDYVQGGGFFGPNLTNGTTRTQFPTSASHADFITNGQAIGQRYGVAGSGGNGQMPGFGPRADDDLGVIWPGLLTQDEIDAIVAYERNL